ncbi:trypsin-like peptidase domain-containing protein [Oscillatoria sp. CS-180]|uniref:trypsin-like peptidase domain-containing protein n=1 Tax=Oscillatoria sp. CS-180 TaxID=3021720 RepID=UPI00232E53DB|nr:trypsin-like peptidase domain-containing protein [Oscillatoria sp. CS-180]MDB9526598.1 trypsin-like peptidase domain-containing protein [Oscillatoria sp. CS-180]
MENLWPCRIRFGAYVLGTAVGLTLSGSLLPNTLTLAGFPGAPKAAIAQNVDEQTNIDVYQTVSPAVVAINAGEGSGSGSIITSTGLILTNAHVVNGSDTVQVRLADGREFTGDVVGYASSRVDLAAVQLRGNPSGLPTVDIAPPGSVQVGQRAFAIGNPFGFEGTLTVGIVSRIDPDRGLIQTDAAINPGNSGGPLLGSDARLIGVNTSIFTTRGGGGGSIGIGFAIPVQEVQAFIAEVNNGTAATSTGGIGDRDRLPERITLNDFVTGRLGSDSDILPDGSFFNAYVFEGQQGQRVAVEMTSQDVDSYLILLSENNDSLYLEDDDSAGDLNARLEITLPQDGSYIIIANSFAQGEQGSYDLRLSEVGAGSVQAPPAGNSERLILRESGVLSPGDEIAPDGTLYDQYTFDGQAGQSVTVTIESQEFDTYLAIVDSNGNLVAENDDISASNTNSEASFTLPNTGRYLVIVNGFSVADQGSYTLIVR